MGIETVSTVVPLAEGGLSDPVVSRCFQLFSELLGVSTGADPDDLLDALGWSHLLDGLHQRQSVYHCSEKRPWDCI